MLSGKQRGDWKHPAEATLLGYRPVQEKHKKVVHRANSSDVLKWGLNSSLYWLRFTCTNTEKIQQCSDFICIPKSLDYQTIQISIKWLTYPFNDRH